MLGRVVTIEQLDEIVLRSKRRALLSKEPIHLIAHRITLPVLLRAKKPGQAHRGDAARRSRRMLALAPSLEPHRAAPVAD